MDTYRVIVYIKTIDIYKEIAADVETWFDISDYELDRLLPKRRKIGVGLMKGELSGKIMITSVGLIVECWWR